MSQDDLRPIDRRHFIASVAATAAACAGLAGCGANDPTAWAGPTDFDLGPADALSRQGVDPRWAISGGFFLVREGTKLYAVSAICSHRACALASQPNVNQYACPCHGSRFTPAGKVLNGPATTSLVHFAIAKNAAGHVTIDRRKMYPEPRWDEPGASLMLG